MQHKTFGGKYVFRLDKGDEIISKISKVLAKDSIKAGVIVSGIGGVDKFTLRFFDASKKRYVDKEFKGQFEMTSLSGNITWMDGQPFIHCHATFGDSKCKVFGGHLGSATIGITGEVVINTFNGEMKRSFNKKIGINKMDLE